MADDNKSATATPGQATDTAPSRDKNAQNQDKQGQGIPGQSGQIPQGQGNRGSQTGDSNPRMGGGATSPTQQQDQKQGCQTAQNQGDEDRDANKPSRNTGQGGGSSANR